MNTVEKIVFSLSWIQIRSGSLEPHHVMALKESSEERQQDVMENDLLNGTALQLAQGPSPNRAPGAAWES